MATAVLTFTLDDYGRQRVGRQHVLTGRLASDDGDYVATGIPITAATFGLNRLDTLDIHGLASDGATAGILFEGAFYDRTASTIQLATSAGDGDPLDESNTTALSAYTIRVTAKGA
jgi:hypothetical protein